MFCLDHMDRRRSRAEKMNQPAVEIVYSFRRFEQAAGRPSGFVVSKYKATREAIKTFQAELIEGTGEEVPARELDRDGRYLPGSSGAT
jgi:hypothetical protein